MQFSLAPHICAVVHARDLVLLDFTSGQYELMAGLGDEVQLCGNARQLELDDLDLAHELGALGLLAPEPTTIGRPIPRPPSSSCLNGAPPAVTLGDRAWMAQGWLQMVSDFHGRGFQALLADAQRRAPTAHALTAAEIQQRATVFDRLSVWTPFQGECLYRCYMLLRLLGSRGCAVDWVFGVRTWPFLAHCWLQLGEVALTDPAERLAMFSPILAV